MRLRAVCLRLRGNNTFTREPDIDEDLGYFQWRREGGGGARWCGRTGRPPARAAL